MGECIMTRMREPGFTLPTDPTMHYFLVTLKSNDNRPISNHTLNVKDGSTYYNYMTNEKGQVMFSTKGGYANIYFTNVIGSVKYHDILNTWINVNAPNGDSTKLNIEHNYPNNIYYTANTIFNIFSNRNCTLVIEGGGGGGGSGSGYGGGGGGSGYVSTHSTINSGQYNFIVGAGGNGGTTNKNGSTGGTSYIVNSSYSAAGGKGGGYGLTNTGGAGGAGYKNGTAAYRKSNYNWVAGSGGNGWFGNGGGSGGCYDPSDEADISISNNGTDGTGGGGAGKTYSYITQARYGKNGGSGFLYIKF